MAKAESHRDTSYIAYGSIMQIINTEQESDVIESCERARRKSSVLMISIIPARITEIENPVNAIYMIVKIMQNSERGFFFTLRNDKMRESPEVSIARCIPLSANR